MSNKDKRWEDNGRYYDYESARARRVIAKKSKDKPRPRHDDLIAGWLSEQEEEDEG